MKTENQHTVLVGAGAGEQTMQNFPHYGFLLEIFSVDRKVWYPVAWISSPFDSTVTQWQAKMRHSPDEYRILVGCGEWLESQKCWSGVVREMLAYFVDSAQPKLKVA